MTSPATGPYGKFPNVGDFEVMHIGGEGGRLIHLGEILNGSGFADFEHARLYLGDGKVVQAEPGGATIVPFDLHDGGMWSTGIITPPASMRPLIAKYGYQCGPHDGQPGVGYSALDYFALGAHRLRLHPLDNLLKARVASSQHLICSQLVDWCYMMAGFQLFDDKRWPGYVTPTDLANLITGNEKTKVSRGKHAL
jgi:hypothetical protein